MLRDRIRSHSSEFFIEETYSLTTFVDQKLRLSVYSYFEKGCPKKGARDNPER